MNYINKVLNQNDTGNYINQSLPKSNPLRKQVIEVLKALVPIFEDDPFILEAILFGSQARGDSKISSDIDIAIVSNNPRGVNRGLLNSRAEDFTIDVNFVYMTPESLANSTSILDVKTSVRKEGISIWKR